MNAPRGYKQPVQPASKYQPRYNQTELQREIVAAEWEQQLPQAFPTLAPTPKNIQILGAFLADKLFTVQALNFAVEDCREQLDWLVPTQPVKTEPVMSELAKREDGSKPTLDLSSMSHTSRDRENRRREEARAAEIAAKEAVDKATREARSTQAKPMPVRQNIGEGSVGLPGKINHSAGRSDAPAAVLREDITTGEFKKLSPADMRLWLAKFPGKQPRPNPSVGGQNDRA